MAVKKMGSTFLKSSSLFTSLKTGCFRFPEVGESVKKIGLFNGIPDMDSSQNICIKWIHDEIANGLLFNCEEQSFFFIEIKRTIFVSQIRGSRLPEEEPIGGLQTLIRCLDIEGL